MGYFGIRLRRRHSRRALSKWYLGKSTGLPIHANAEVVIEGEVLPDTHIKEGPYGEWTGYYASGERTEQVLRVNRLMYRDRPIITGAPSSRPPGGADDGLIRSAFIWDYMEKAGVPDVRGVALYQGRFFSAISIKQRYPGHAKQAACIAAQCATGAYLGRYVVVVDDDIDVYDINDVLWALGTRSDPSERYRRAAPLLERSTRSDHSKRRKRIQFSGGDRRHPAL